MPGVCCPSGQGVSAFCSRLVLIEQAGGQRGQRLHPAVRCIARSDLLIVLVSSRNFHRQRWETAKSSSRGLLWIYRGFAHPCQNCAPRQGRAVEFTGLLANFGQRGCRNACLSSAGHGFAFARGAKLRQGGSVFGKTAIEMVLGVLSGAWRQWMWCESERVDQRCRQTAHTVLWGYVVGMSCH